ASGPGLSGHGPRTPGQNASPGLWPGSDGPWTDRSGPERARGAEGGEGGGGEPAVVQGGEGRPGVLRGAGGEVVGGGAGRRAWASWWRAGHSHSSSKNASSPISSRSAWSAIPPRRYTLSTNSSDGPGSPGGTSSSGPALAATDRALAAADGPPVRSSQSHSA